MVMSSYCSRVSPSQTAQKSDNTKKTFALRQTSLRIEAMHHTPHSCAPKGTYIGLHNSAHRYMNIAWRVKECKDNFVNVSEIVIKLILFCLFLSKISENTQFQL